MASTTDRKRKCLSLEMKVMLIEKVEKKLKSKAEICREHGIPSSTLHTILKDRDYIRSAFLSGSFQHERKKIRKSDYEDLDCALHTWFRQARSNNVPISGPILIEKGKELAESLGHINFSLSMGWLSRFKMRHGIKMKEACIDAESVSEETTEKCKQSELQELLKHFEPKDIYNADETCLFYKYVPNCTGADKGEACSNHKIPIDRLSILIAANMDGDKLPLLAIGKFQNPRCFKNVRTLPTEYKFNKNSCMTGSLFQQWVRNLDREFLLQGRSIALIVNNCSTHPSLTCLKAISLFFLSPDMTSVTQPLDHGIIDSFKMLYRKNILKKLISVIKNEGSSSYHLNVNILDALTMAGAAWNDVKADTIVKCFNRAGFIITDETACTEPCAESLSSTTSAYRTDIDNLFDRLRGIAPISITADEYLSVDETFIPTEELSSQGIAQNILEERADAEEEEEKDTRNPVSKITTKTASQAVETLRMFFMQQADSSAALTQLNFIENLVDNFAIKVPKQSTIDSFFKPRGSTSQ